MNVPADSTDIYRLSREPAARFRTEPSRRDLSAILFEVFQRLLDETRAPESYPRALRPETEAKCC